MSDVKEYLDCFKIFVGLRICGYIITRIDIDYEEIIQYKKYKYPIIIFFNNEYINSFPDMLLREFKRYVSEIHIVKSKHRGLYKCDFGNPKIFKISGNNISIETIGYSIIM